MSQTHRQVTAHDTEVQIHEEADHAYVEVILHGGGIIDSDDPIFLSLTPAEARELGDALLSSSQRVEDRIPHTNC